MTGNLLLLLPALLLGGLAGTAYFALLWLTLRSLGQVRHPALWILLSLVLRMALLLLALYWIGQGQWQRLLAALLGVVLARLILTRRLQSVQQITAVTPSVAQREE